MTKKKPTKKPAPKPTRNVSNGKPKKPEKPPKKYPKKKVEARKIPLASDLYERLRRRASVMETTPSKLVDRLLVDFLDAIPYAAQLTSDEQHGAANIIVGGYPLKSRGLPGCTGPMIHVDPSGVITRAGLPGSKFVILSSAQPHDRTGEAHTLRGEDATRSRNVEDGPIAVTTTDGNVEEYDPALHEDVDADLAADAGDLADTEAIIAAEEAEAQTADEERVADASEFGEP